MKKKSPVAIFMAASALLASNTLSPNLVISEENTNKLGGLIALSSLINLPIFFIAIKRNKITFASGIVAFLILVVLLIAFLKLSTQ